VFKRVEMSSDESDGGEGRGGRQKMVVRQARPVYAQRYFALNVEDLVSLAKSKVNLQFIREFNDTWQDDSFKEDALILALGRTRGLEPFGITVMRLPGATHAMVIEQRKKLRIAVRTVLNSFKK